MKLHVLVENIYQLLKSSSGHELNFSLKQLSERAFKKNTNFKTAYRYINFIHMMPWSQLFKEEIIYLSQSPSFQGRQDSSFWGS